jgi:hypothetical protein
MLSIDDLFKGRHFDREIIILCVRWYLRFKLRMARRASPDGPLAADLFSEQRKRPSRTTSAEAGLESKSGNCKDIGKASANAFDRETGSQVSSTTIRIYREALAQYHLSPESKFHNGDFLTAGEPCVDISR